MKNITEKLLKFGDIFEFSGEDNVMEICFSKEIQHHTGHGFCLWFNGRLQSFKTFKGLQNRANTIIDKFGLAEPDEEDYYTKNSISTNSGVGIQTAI